MLGAIVKKYFGKAVIRGLLVLVCLFLRDGLTVLSMWSESAIRMMYVKILLAMCMLVGIVVFGKLCPVSFRVVFVGFVAVVVCLQRPMEGMGRLQFSVLFTELPVLPQAAGLVATFLCAFFII